MITGTAGAMETAVVDPRSGALTEGGGDTENMGMANANLLDGPAHAVEKPMLAAPLNGTEGAGAVDILYRSVSMPDFVTPHPETAAQLVMGTRYLHMFILIICGIVAVFQARVLTLVVDLEKSPDTEWVVVDESEKKNEDKKEQ